MKSGRLYNLFLNYFIKKSFRIWQKMGFHITPNHFYEPVPDTRTLGEGLWSKHSDMCGVEINEKRQINFLSQFSSKFKEEFECFPRFKTSVPYQYYVNNGTFGSVDGEILYCMIRQFKPRKIFEIESGNSTYLAAQAIQRNKKAISGFYNS